MSKSYFLILNPSVETNAPAITYWKGGAPNPIEIGDTVNVIAFFGNYKNGGDAVPAVEYYGLSVGACFSEGVDAMESALNLNEKHTGVLQNITTASTPRSDDFFSNAVQISEPIKRDGQTINVTTIVTMIYNPGADIISKINNSSASNIDIVVDYGDPHEKSIGMPVKKIQ